MYKKDNPLLDKSLKFAARIVKLHNYLIKEKHESIISKQIIRSATSIGANANEAIYGQSKADFLSKLHISLKETAETEYWLRLLILTDYVTEAEGESLIKQYRKSIIKIILILLYDLCSDLSEHRLFDFRGVKNIFKNRYNKYSNNSITILVTEIFAIWKFAWKKAVENITD